MSISTFVKPLTFAASIFSLVTISNFIAIAPTYGFGVTLDGFEGNNLNNWTTTGDTSVQDTFQTTTPIVPTEGSKQAVLTTSCPSGVFPSGECVDLNNTSLPRPDDSATPAGTFSFSGSDQTDANAENSTGDILDPQNMQDFLGLSQNALNIPRESGTTPISSANGRTPKEGSAIKQTINSTEPFQISFDWNYLTNDGASQDLGDSDYGFVTIYETSSNVLDRSIEILADSDVLLSEPLPDPYLSATVTEFLYTNGYQSYISDRLPAGEYVLGFGVVDIDGVNRSSALVLDNVQTLASTAVPFDFSPTAGLVIVAGLMGIRSKYKVRATKCPHLLPIQIKENI